jgi:hypothetical protein
LIGSKCLELGRRCLGLTPASLHKKARATSANQLLERAFPFAPQHCAELLETRIGKTYAKKLLKVSGVREQLQHHGFMLAAFLDRTTTQYFGCQSL